MTKTILVADDSKTLQTVVTLTFRATDFKVVTASDGDDALRKIAELSPALVIADVAMPGKNGYDLCAALRGAPATAGLPVLLMAGSFEPIDEHRAVSVGASGHIKKPFDTQGLLDRVRALTGGSVATDVPMSFAASLAARQAAAAGPSPTEVARAEQARQEALKVEHARIEHARAAETARIESMRAEAARQESVRQAEAARSAEVARIEAARHAELARQEAARQSELARQEAARQAELTRQAEAHRQAEAARFEAARQAELARQADIARQAEAARIEAARQTELARQAESARQDAARQAEAARQVEPSRAEGRSFAADLGVPTGARAEGSPFGPPREGARPPLATRGMPASPGESAPLMFEEPELIEDGEIVEELVDELDGELDGESAQVPTGPYLEPPTPPGDRLAAANVDVWALAEEPAGAARAGSSKPAPRTVADDGPRQAAIDRATAAVQGEGDIEAIEEIDLDEIPADKAVAQTSDARAAAAAKVAEHAAAPIAAAVQAVVPGLGHDELVRIAREVIERVAWEVVPDLAEVIIKAELERLTRE